MRVGSELRDGIRNKCWYALGTHLVSMGVRIGAYLVRLTMVHYIGHETMFFQDDSGVVLCGPTLLWVGVMVMMVVVRATSMPRGKLEQTRKSSIRGSPSF